jgi:hypothetical protein
LILNSFLTFPARPQSNDKQRRLVVKDYTIVFWAPASSFAISLLSKPLTAARHKAEQTFLKDLGVSQDDACKLAVNLGVPVSVDPDVAGILLGLSFCPGAVQLR